MVVPTNKSMVSLTEQRGGNLVYWMKPESRSRIRKHVNIVQRRFVHLELVLLLQLLRKYVSNHNNKNINERTRALVLYISDLFVTWHGSCRLKTINS